MQSFHYTLCSLRNQASGSILLTPEQTMWVANTQMVMNMNPRVMRRPADWFRSFIFNTVSSPWFERIVFALVGANVAVLCALHVGQGPVFADSIVYMSTAFTAIFCFEAVMRIIAFGPRYYFSTFR